MTMMGGSSNTQGLFDLLTDSGRLRAHIDELHQANLARNKSADEHRRVKASAEETLAQLHSAKVAHDAREQEIVALRAETENLRHQLALELAATKAKQLELDKASQDLEAEAVNHQTNVRDFIEKVKVHQQNIAMQQMDLSNKAKELGENHRELQKREADATVREQFLIAAAHELTRPR